MPSVLDLNMTSHASVDAMADTLAAMVVVSILRPAQARVLGRGDGLPAGSVGVRGSGHAH